jgi:hypothetical protein
MTKKRAGGSGKGFCNEKAAPTAGQCGPEPPVGTIMYATIYAKDTGAFLIQGVSCEDISIGSVLQRHDAVGAAADRRGTLGSIWNA